MATRTLSPSYQAARVRSFAKRNGPRWLQQRIWDWEFKKGRWTYLEASDDQELFGVLVERLGGGRLLDLGCGNGAARCGLPFGAFRRYVGVDLSAEALRRLEARTVSLPPVPDGEVLIAGDFADEEVIQRMAGPFEVILLHDSIYYVEQVQSFCKRMAELLSAEGVIVVRIHDRNRYAPFVSAIRDSLEIVEERAPEDDRRILIVARGRAGG